MKTESGVIYRATCILTGKSYIGQTMDFERRKSQHKNGHSVGCSHFNRAIEKHGKDTFEWDIICAAVDKSTLNALEICYIQVLDTLAPGGYNLKTGGEGGQHSEDVRRRISENHGRSMLGKKHSLEARCKMSEAQQRRKPASTETRQKLSEAGKGEKNPFYGKKHSPEALQKMSDAHKGKPSPMRGRQPDSGGTTEDVGSTQGEKLVC